MIRGLFLLLLVPQLSFGHDLDKIIKKSGVPKSDLGICIGAATSPIYEVNSKQKLIPASLSKILTGIAALKTFGSGYRFKTQLYVDGEVTDQTLKGKLYIKGGGDPSLVSENMWVLVNNFLRNDIRKIDGSVVVDNSAYDNAFIDSSREDSRVDRAYDSPVSAAPFNWNSIGVYVRPGKKKGDAVKVFMDPWNSYFKVTDKATTTSGSGQDVWVTRTGKEIIVTGKMGIGHSEKVFYKNIDDPVQWVGTGLLDFLGQRGIEVVNKKVQEGKVPSGARLVAEAPGWSIDELVNGMLRFSNNFIAEMLTKNLALSNGASQGTIATGVHTIKKMISTYGVKESEYEFINPSGLSRENKLTAQQLSTILENARKDFWVSGGFMNALPFPSGEGSLSKRMVKLDEKRWIRAKTGLLTGVVGLAGYIGQKNSEPITFVFIYNGNGKEEKARELFDRLAVEMVNK